MSNIFLKFLIERINFDMIKISTQILDKFLLTFKSFKQINVHLIYLMIQANIQRFFQLNALG